MRRGIDGTGVKAERVEESGRKIKRGGMNGRGKKGKDRSGM